MNKGSINIQSVLYFNPRENLERTMDSIARAIEISLDKDCCLSQFTLSYGDASSSPIFSENDIYWLKKKYEGLFNFKYQFFGFNSGTSRGHNIMAENCASDYIMTMNPDIVFAHDFFSEIMRPFANTFLNAGLSEARQTPIEHPKEYNRKTGETSWCSGAGTVIPTDLFRKVGGYDQDSFFMYCDDVDLSWRIRMLGYRAIYCPSAIIYHSKYLDFGAQLEHTDVELYYSAESALFMAHKWSNPARLELLINQMKNGGNPIQEKAVKTFLSKKYENNLPEPLDSNHEIAEFVGDNYTSHRFVM